jgi:hypothetical protein
MLCATKIVWLLDSFRMKRWWRDPLLSSESSLTTVPLLLTCRSLVWLAYAEAILLTSSALTFRLKKTIKHKKNKYFMCEAALVFSISKSLYSISEVLFDRWNTVNI